MDHSIYLISALTAYHAVGAKVVLAASSPRLLGQDLIVHDIVSADYRPGKRGFSTSTA